MYFNSAAEYAIGWDRPEMIGRTAFPLVRLLVYFVPRFCPDPWYTQKGRERAALVKPFVTGLSLRDLSD